MADNLKTTYSQKKGNKKKKEKKEEAWKHWKEMLEK